MESPSFKNRPKTYPRYPDLNHAPAPKAVLAATITL